MPISSKRLFDIAPDVGDDPNDVDGETQKTQKKARRDASALKRRALQAIAENPDE